VIQVLGLDHVVLRVRDALRMTRFYCDVLGCKVERSKQELGLVQLRAGQSLIDLVTFDGELGQKGGAAPGTGGRNMDHFCLRVEPFDPLAVIAHLTRDVFVPASSSGNETGFNALGYAADVVLPIIDLGQESRWQIDASQKWADLVEPLVWLAIVIGWVSSTAFLIALQRYFRSSQGSG